MRYNKIAAVMVAGVIALTSIIALPKQNTVYAQEAATYIGNLSEAKISVDGNEPITIQSYNVDGYNYVRAREITNILDMNILGDRDGVMVKPYENAEDAEGIERLTDDKITVKMVNGYIYYSGYNSIETRYFNYKDRDYFKLADLGTAAQKHKESRLEVIPVFTGPPMEYERYMRTFTISWDEATSTVLINTEMTDLVNHYNAVNGIKPQDTSNNPPVEPVPEKPYVRKDWPEYTSANEIPDFPAEIMINPSKGAEVSNLIYPYRLTGLYGECTWYAIGRFYEVFGIDIAHDENNIYGYGNWISEAMSGKYPDIEGIPYLGNGDLSNMPNRGIAEWKGHVVFIEYVERDENGYPVKIYFTEANAGSATKNKGYDPEYDGRIKSSNSLSGFLSASGEDKFYGFVVPKNK